MEVQDLRRKIKDLSNLKVAARQSSFLKGYENIFLNYGAMCYFMYNKFDEFDQLDIEMFSNLGDAIINVHNRLKVGEQISIREINILNILIDQYSDTLTSLYGFVTPLKEESIKAELNETVSEKLRELNSELDYLDFLYILYRAKELHSPEGVSVIEVCDEVISYLRKYRDAIETRKDKFTSAELSILSGGLDKAEDLIAKLRVVITPLNKNVKDMAFASLQDFLAKAHETKFQK